MTACNIMIDIETLGIKPGSVILSIGAVAFDPFGKGHDTGSEFYESCSIFEQLMNGFTIDQATVNWWKEKSYEAQSDLFLTNNILKNTLSNLTKFIARESLAKSQHPQIWAKSPDFDCAHIDEALRRYGFPPIWTFRDKRDVRTIRALEPIAAIPSVENVNLTYHNALDDCKYQVLEVQQAIAALKR